MKILEMDLVVLIVAIALSQFVISMKTDTRVAKIQFGHFLKCPVFFSMSRGEVKTGISTWLIFRVLLLLFLLNACSEEAGFVSMDTSHLMVKTKSIQIPLDEETAHEIFIALTQVRNDTAYLVTLNHLINGSNIYNLNTLEQVRKIKLPRSGPDGISAIAGVQMSGPDTLLFIAKGSPANSRVTDFEGNLLSNANFQAFWDYGMLNPVANSNAPVYLIDGQLHFVTYPDYSFSKAESHNGIYQWEKLYSWQEGTLKSLPVYLPEAYHYKLWSPVLAIVGRVKGHDDFWVYNWPISRDLQVIDWKKDSSFRVTAMASTHKNILPLSPNNYAKRKIAQIVENTTYRRLYYDPYRSLYYRIATTPITYIPAMHANYDALFNQALEVIVLDTTFQVIARKTLPANTYGIYGCFSGPEGFYIPRNNIYLNNLEEEKLTCDVFQVIPK